MRLLGWLFNLAVYGFFASVLLIAAIFWWHSRDLKSTTELAEYEPATLSRLYASDGSVMAEFARERRLFTPIDEIPDLVKHAFISAEDRNFYTHAGVDGVGLVKAIVDNVQRAATGRRLRGASTITMQVVKNFLLSGDRQISRKIKELLLASRLEDALTKDQILELYLNEIFLGSNAYGVTSAADRYFNKRLEALTPAEAAYLAALPKAPSNLHPVRHNAYATERRNYVLREMRENGYIDRAAFADAVKQPLVTEFHKSEKRVGGRRGSSGGIDYFAEEIYRQLSAGEALSGVAAVQGEDGLMTGGFAVRATMDSELQDHARRTLQDQLWRFSRRRGYGGPAARLTDFDPAAQDDDGAPAWRKRLAETKVPRDIDGWKPAVVLAVRSKGAEIGIEGVESDAPILLPFSDVRKWARQRLGANGKGDALFGPELTKPSQVWRVGDVIYVTQATKPQKKADAKKSEDAAAQPEKVWSMRQIPDVNGALVALDPRTGRVLALQGGFSFDDSKFNRATQAKRQPGSAFKPFVYAAALKKGYSPNSVFLDAPITLEQPDGSLWTPKNYSEKFYGSVPMRWGLEKSHNLMTIRVATDVGLENLAEFAKEFGVYDDMPPLLSFALGAGETTLLRLAGSYAMFVNGGKKVTPTLIDRVQDRWGQTVFRHDKRICTECRAPEYFGQEEPYVPDEGDQVIDPIVAFQMVSMLEGVTVRGTARSVGRAFDFPVAGKTGTTNQARDAWFVGFTNDLVVGCYVGFDNNTPLGDKMSGGKVCGPIFTDFVKKAIERRKPGPFRRPREAVMVKIDRNSGCAVPAKKKGADFIWEPFSPEKAPYVGQCPEGGIGGRATTAREAELRQIPQERTGFGEEGGGQVLGARRRFDEARETRDDLSAIGGGPVERPSFFQRLFGGGRQATRDRERDQAVAQDAEIDAALEDLGLGGQPSAPSPGTEKTVEDGAIGGGLGGLY